MRRLHVDREDDPVPGIRDLDPQEQSARPALPIYVGARKGTAIAGLWEKVLAKHHTIRRRLDDSIRFAVLQIWCRERLVW